MKVECSNCKETIEFTEKRPAFCGHCGHSLSDVNIHDAATLAYPAAASTAGSDFTLGGAPPRVVGRYRLGRELGQGGMGVVYEAEHDESGRRVALKLLTPGMPQSQESMDRFLREGRLAAALSHSRSTFVYEAGEHAGQPYIAMELMPGRTLHHVSAEEGALPVNRAIDYILDVIDGLEAAHAVGVIHRDVKPSNCFLDDSGRVKVGDFGLSKSLVTDASLTRTGAFMGTPLFAAPEQVRAGKIDERTDIYAVGATLFFLIARRGPFVGDPAAVIAQISSDPAPSIRGLVPSVPKVLDAIIARTLDKEPARRFLNLAQLRQALLPFATGGTSIADIGRRLGAYMVDMTACGMVVGIGYAIVGILAGVGAFGSSVEANQFATQALVASFVAWLVQIGYFVVAEGGWGRALGKWLLGLRVVGVTGEPPGFRRMLVRAFFIPGGLGLTLPFIFLASLAERNAISRSGDQTAAHLGVTLMGLLPYVPTLLCLMTMRKRNGYRGLHELASGTRVVRLRRALDEARLRNVAILAPVKITEPARSFGPFRETGMLGQSAQTSVRVARDDILHRPVWIHVGEHGSAGYAAERVGVARPTRPRWLQGGQTDAVRWDAFEALVGAPLVEAVGPEGGLSWERSRIVLLDLAEELRVAALDGTLPASLSLDQVWLDRSGHVKLLDHPIEPCVPQTSSTTGLQDRSGPVPHGARKSPGPVAGQSSGRPSTDSIPPAERAGNLLRAAAHFCTGGQLLPGHAQEFLRSLATRPPTQETLDWAVAQLRELIERSAMLRWDDRLGILGVVMATEYTFYWTVGLMIAMLSWHLTDDTALRLLAPFIFDLFAPALLGFWLCGGPAFWFLGIEVRRPDGQLASRLRCAWRNVVAWIPLILFNGSLPFFMNMQPKTYGPQSLTPQELAMVILSCSGSCLMFFAILGLIYGIVRPQRGVQDLLAGTCLLPR
jgi:uncharacterized RDD family membrane protein YckC